MARHGEPLRWQLPTTAGAEGGLRCHHSLPTASQPSVAAESHCCRPSRPAQWGLFVLNRCVLVHVDDVLHTVVGIRPARLQCGCVYLADGRLVQAAFTLVDNEVSRRWLLAPENLALKHPIIMRVGAAPRAPILTCGASRLRARAPSSLSSCYRAVATTKHPTHFSRVEQCRWQGSWLRGSDLQVVAAFTKPVKYLAIAGGGGHP